MWKLALVSLLFRVNSFYDLHRFLMLNTAAVSFSPRIEVLALDGDNISTNTLTSPKGMRGPTGGFLRSCTPDYPQIAKPFVYKVVPFPHLELLEMTAGAATAFRCPVEQAILTDWLIRAAEAVHHPPVVLLRAFRLKLPRDVEEPEAHSGQILAGFAHGLKMGTVVGKLLRTSGLIQ
jgi:hypothetical protein